ncbi:phage protein [Escherichia coli]|uniref:phage protein n=1 Tax=Escherichia coli TaxID=562 RepID=UPI003D196CE6
MTTRINGMAFDTFIGGTDIHVKSISLDISDESAVAKTRGIPDGKLRGLVMADGEIDMSTRIFNHLGEVASQAGSWRDLPPMDFVFYANTGTEEIRVEAFGCELMLSGLLSIDTESADLTTHKIKYVVASPDIVRINGVPVLSENDVRGLMG